MVARLFKSRNCGVRPILLNLRTLKRSTPWLAVVSLFLSCFSARIGFGATQQDAAEASSPQPALQIELLPLGFGGLSASARQTANVTVDFLDVHHVLLTFNPKKLFQRLPDCPPSHDDRLIHAMVLEVPGGRVLRKTDWYLHDARRFVWPLGSGRVLLRTLNKLYEVDSNLIQKQVFDSPKELLWVSVTPDGKQIITETSEGSLPSGVKTKNRVRVKVSFLDADSWAVQRVIQSRDVVRLEATSSGFADVRKKGSAWLIRFGPVNIARIRGVPNILYSSANTMLVGRCSVSRNGYNVSAFTVTGNSLWRERWSDCRYSPVVRRSEDGSRFAFGTIAIPARTNPPGSARGIDPEEENLTQTVQVFDTASGNPLISLRATQAVLDGQNLSLSPDGRQLAVIVGSAMKIYPLREMSAGERAKYIAVKSDTPGLYVPAPQTGKDAAEEPLYASAAEEESDAAEQQGPELNSSTQTPDTAKPAPTKGIGLSAGSPATGPNSNLGTPMLTLRSLSQIVALDVVVTDSEGHVVKGLQQMDFTVAEDGKPQRVSYFSERAGAQSASPSTSPAAPPAVETLPANIFSNQSQPVEPGSTTVVLLDLLNTPLSDQSHAQAELVKFIKSKPKNSQFALFTLANRLQMIQGFTQDGNVLLAAANGKKASLRQRPLMDSDTVLRPSLEAGVATAKFLPDRDFFVQSLQLQESEVRVMDADQRVSVTLDAFAHLARYLSGVPGRKNLVWLSGSFQLSIYPNVSGETPFLQGRIYSERLKKAANLLAEAHVAVYPVDVKGLATDPLFSAASNDLLTPLSMQGSTPGIGGGGPRGRNVTTAVPIAVMQNQAEQFASSQAGERATMSQLAAQTGGQAFYNTNGIAKAIETATEEGSNYYALSYAPFNKKTDGAFRKVKVSLAGKKYRLAYRSGYYAVAPSSLTKPSKDLTSSLARAAMQQGSPQSRQVVFGARVVPLGKPRMVKDEPGRSKPSTRKRKDMNLPVEMQRYSIDYAVIPTDLRFAPAPEGTYRDVLNFMITAFDDDGNLVASQVSQMIADLKPETMRDAMVGGLRLHQEIDIPVKSVAMRLGVEDTANSHLGTLEIPLPVKPPPDMPTAAARKSLPPIEPD